MNSPTVVRPVSALALLYEKAREQCRWLRTLSPAQMQTIASLMMEWQAENDHHEIMPLEEIERREILRALTFFEGNVKKTARSLRIGKTTLHRKLIRWGYKGRNRLLLVQAAALGDPAERKGPLRAKSIPSSQSAPNEHW